MKSHAQIAEIVRTTSGVALCLKAGCGIPDAIPATGFMTPDPTCRGCGGVVLRLVHESWSDNYDPATRTLSLPLFRREFVLTPGTEVEMLFREISDRHPRRHP